MTNELYLSLGSNIGNREANLLKAYDELEKRVGTILKKSSFFENEAVGFETEDLFINTCLQMRTELSPESIILTIKDIEKKLGRIYDKNAAGYQSRLIDIDVIFYGSEKILTKDLVIPHPLFHKRTFVLFPLAEIAENFVNPNTQLTVLQTINLLGK